MKRAVSVILLLAFVLAANGEMKSSVSQFGITWTFDKAYECGQFVNGDWWVVGPVKINSVSPAQKSTAQGSAVNPMPGGSQAYDSRISGFSTSLRPSFPLTLNANQSLVSTVENPVYDSSDPYRTPILTAAVLTCVAAPITEPTFRPPFCGSSYKPYFKKSQLRTNMVPALAPTTGAPTATELAPKFQRPWLDHKTGWSCRPMHPKENMPNYGREIMKLTGSGALTLCLDIPNKEQLLINYVQVGIDLFGMFKNGHRWYADGGHANGRKLVILTAAQMLGDSQMMNVSNPWAPGKFGEDDHTYYGQPTTEYPEGKPLYGKVCNPPNYPYSGSGAKDCRDPNGITDDGVGYGTVNHPHWPGEALAAHIMGIKDMWNHNAFFDFVDRYMKKPWSGTPPQFQLGMWLTYRNNLPTNIKGRSQNSGFRIQHDQQITLYPNPMKDMIWFDSRSGDIQQITIYDNTGNAIHTIGANSRSPLRWCGNDLAGNGVQPGVYYYSILMDRKQVGGRIIKAE